MERYWKVIDSNGNEFTEKEHDWKNVKQDIKKLSLVLEDKNIEISLPSGVECFQSKTASANLGGGEISIESRNLTFKLGNNNILLRVHEETGNLQVEIS